MRALTALFLLALSSSLWAQPIPPKADPTRVMCGLSQSAFVVFITPLCIQMDPLSFTLDRTVQPPVLRLLGGGGGGVIPNTGNLITGGPMNQATDSGVAPASVVTLAGVQSLTNKTVDGVSPTTFSFLDPTSSVQTQLNGKQATLGFTPENVTNKSTNTSLGTSDTLYPSQNAVKVYVDGHVGGGSVFTGSGAFTVGSSATPTFSLANVSLKSPIVFNISPVVNVTAPTITNKSAGAKFSISVTTDGTHTWNWNGIVADSVCPIYTDAASTTVAELYIDPDGTTVHGIDCKSSLSNLLAVGATGSAASVTPTTTGNIDCRLVLASGIDCLGSDGVHHNMVGSSGNVSGFGLFSGRPTGSQGDQYFCSDPCLYSYIKGASAWQSMWQGSFPATPPPVAASFTVVNGGTITNVTGGGLHIEGTTSTFRPFTIAAPGSSYSFIVCMVNWGPHSTGAVPLVGVLFSDGTQYEYMYTGQNTISVDYNSAVNTFNSHELQTGGNLFEDICFKLTDDLSATKTFSYSKNHGITWVQYLSEARTTNLTPTRIGFIVNAGNSNTKAEIDVYHYLAQ